jgi:hypothetical protein
MADLKRKVKTNNFPGNRVSSFADSDSGWENPDKGSGMNTPDP